MIRKHVNYFTFLVVINPFMIISFQNCSKVPEGKLASISKEQKTMAVEDTRLPSSLKNEVIKN